MDITGVPDGRYKLKILADPATAMWAIILTTVWWVTGYYLVIYLAGLQDIPAELYDAAKVDGATPWQSFWQITFPLMLPVSVTAIILKIIFQLKLADIVINVTAGGPGGATDTVSSFIFREYRDRSNVGYGTMLAEFYLVLIIIFVLLLLHLVSRWMRKAFLEPSGSTRGSRKQLRPSGAWASTRKASDIGAEQNHLWPTSSKAPSPAGSARVLLARTSEPPCFSVIAMPHVMPTFSTAGLSAPS